MLSSASKKQLRAIAKAQCASQLLKAVHARYVHNAAPPRSVIIAGGGIAGLTAAIALSATCKVTLIAGQRDSSAAAYSNSLLLSKLDPYQGLWTGGLECLDSIAPGIVRELEKEGRLQSTVREMASNTI
eukprot:20430-Heterococcus_DN1.PRE.2